MATYLAFREARGIMTNPTNVTMDIVARFIMFCALQGMVFTFLPRVFPGV
jgi:cytochrome c oxidase subunit I+III